MKKNFAIKIVNSVEFKKAWCFFDKTHGGYNLNYPEIHREYPCLIEHCSTNVRWVDIKNENGFEVISFDNFESILKLACTK